MRIFVGVIARIDPHIETPEEVRVRSFEPGEELALVLHGRLICD
jgi:hypothetical protein